MDEWKAPRPHTTRRAYSIQLAICFIATLLFLAILGLLSMAFGQEHPFPFKTLEEITAGTPAWVLVYTGPPRFCSGKPALIVKRVYHSGAESAWTVYTDGILFTSSYFPPGQEQPVEIVTGQITNGVVYIKIQHHFDPDRHHPCDPWLLKGA